MFKYALLLFLLIITSCDSSNLKLVNNLSKTLNEVSGNEISKNSNIIWMINDSGNKARLYAVDFKGNIKKTLEITAKNNDWEDVTSDDFGNIYIGDFGNNENKRKNLAILKVAKKDLNNDSKIPVERITFHYENQHKFPPKKKLHFDCESFFYFKNHFYLFTKSRAKSNHGLTNLYKIPATVGHHEAKFISSFSTCPEIQCWITAADISDDGKQVVLLSPNAILLFSNFSSDYFFDGDFTSYYFNQESQKEGICFKNKNTLFITNEKGGGSNADLYEFRLNQP